MKYQIEQNEILKVKRGVSNIHRDLAIYLCRFLTQKKLMEIGVYFKTYTYSTISNAIIRAKKRILENKTINKDVNALIDIIKKSQKKI